MFHLSIIFLSFSLSSFSTTNHFKLTMFLMRKNRIASLFYHKTSVYVGTHNLASLSLLSPSFSFSDTVAKAKREHIIHLGLLNAERTGERHKQGWTLISKGNTLK